MGIGDSVHGLCWHIPARARTEKTVRLSPSLIDFYNKAGVEKWTEGERKGKERLPLKRSECNMGLFLRPLPLQYVF